ncbi:MAG TPA: metallophosphoesterase family protein [Polyangiaceae bacterium]
MRRTILVGDVHGCSAELQSLLDKVALASGDQLVFVGDLVAKGPDSRGVLRLMRELGARSVIGNHEERVLAGRAAERADRTPPRLDPTHRALLEELEDEEWAELEALPLGIELPEHELRIVHAGVVPGIPFAEQDPWLLTHIRSISEDGVPSSKWGPLWGARYTGPPHVVFGHNARKDPQLHPDATGLDTACVYGGELTALVLPEAARLPAPADRRDALVAVPARRAYSDYGRPLS